MSTIYERALEKHAKWKGKLEVSLKAPLETNDDLSMAYTPGVAQPCIEIEKDPESVYRYTWKGNSVAIVTDGSAVLGLGDIGAMAGLPVMEGKSILFKRFAGIDAVPICLDARDPKDIIRIVKAIAPSFGGINLEDISAPRCVEIERALIEELDIPVFHDDQHGTAIVVTAGLINALKLVRKKADEITVVISGTGAAGSSIIRMLKDLGVKVIYAFNKDGMVVREEYEKYDHLVRELVEITNADSKKVSIGEALKGADVFIGVSAPGLLTAEMVSGMKNDSIVFALANPEPEISYAEAIAGGARIVATGRSDYPNQINNVLAFPGLFRGAFNVRARKINEGMKMAAAMGIASLVSDTELSEEYIVPSVLDPRVTAVVAKAVSEKAVETCVSSI